MSYYVSLETPSLSLTQHHLQWCIDVLASQCSYIVQQQQQQRRHTVIAVAIRDVSLMSMSWLAIHRAGYAFLSLNPTHPLARLQHSIDDVNVTAILVCTNDMLGTHAITSFERFIGAIDDDCVVIPIDILLKQHTLSRRGVHHIAIKEEESSNLSHIVFTSGSTGRPKPVMVSRCALSTYATAKTSMLCSAPGSRVLLCSACTFDPCIGDVFATVNSGMKSTLLMAPSHQALLEDLDYFLRSLHATHVCTTPGVWSLVNCEGAIENTFAALSSVQLGGETMPTTLCERWVSSPVKLFNAYGVTEATVYQSFALMGSGKLNEVKRIDGVLKPGINIGLFIDEGMTNDHDQEKKVVCGEVVLWGAQVADGYFGFPAISANQFMPLPDGGRAYRTGDIAKMCFHDHGSKQVAARTDWLIPLFTDEYGDVNYTVELLGRHDDQLKVRGNRIEPSEIEAAVLASPFVAQAAAIYAAHQLVVFIVAALPCPAWWTEFVSIATMSEPDIQRYDAMCACLRRWCELELPVAVIPSQFVPVTFLPTTYSDKIDRRSLAVSYEASNLRLGKNDTDFKMMDELPEESSWALIWVARFWANFLHVPLSTVHRFSDFTRLGGDSLVALRVVRRLRETALESASVLDPPTGVITGPLAAGHLLAQPVLDDYVAFLLSQGVLPPTRPVNEYTRSNSNDNISAIVVDSDSNDDDNDSNEFSFALVSSDDEDDAVSSTTSALPHCKLDIELELLLEASSTGNDKVVRSLLGAPARGRSSVSLASGHLSGRDQGVSPLHVATKFGHVTVVDALLAAGAVTRTVFKSTKASVLHLAAALPNSQILNAILAHPSPPLITAIDVNKQTAMHYATRAGSTENMLALIKYDSECSSGLLLHWFDRWSRSALHWAVVNGHNHTVRVALQALPNADLNFILRNAVRRTSTHLRLESMLHTAARLHGSNEELAVLLLDAGADWKSFDIDGNTVVHAAAVSGCLTDGIEGDKDPAIVPDVKCNLDACCSVLRVLLSRHPEAAYIHNKYGQLPQEMASKAGQHAAEGLLLKATLNNINP